MASRVRLSKKTLDGYREALEASHRRYDTEAKPYIETLCKYLRGDQLGTEPSSSLLPRIVANLLYSDAKVIIPALVMRNPRILVRPAGATVMMPIPSEQGTKLKPVKYQIEGPPVDILDAAQAQEHLINWRWHTLGITKQVRRVLMDALTAPFGVMKVGYTLATEKIQVEAESPELLETHEFIKADAPYAVRWCPRDFRVNIEARYPDLSDADWVAFGWRARLEDVKRNPRYKNTKNLKATSMLKTDFPQFQYDVSMGTTPSDRMLIQGDDNMERVQLWEIWDKRRGKLITLADDHDSALEFEDWPLDFINFPAKTLCTFEYPDEFYGPPELWQVKGQQDAYNVLTSMVVNHVKRFLRKYVAPRGAFDEKELEKLKLPIDGTVVLTDMAIRDAIGPIPDAPIPADWWQARVNVREDHDRISGVSDMVRGMAEKVDTATEARGIQENIAARTADARTIVEDFAKSVAVQLLRIDGQTLDVPKVVPVIGNPDSFITIKDKGMLAADTDVRVEIGSMQPDSPRARREAAMQLYQTLRGDPMSNQFRLREIYVESFRDVLPEAQEVPLTIEQFRNMQAMQQQEMGAAPPGQPPAATTPGPPPGMPPGPPRPVGRPPLMPRPPV